MHHELTISNLVGEPQISLLVIDNQYVHLKVVENNSLTPDQLHELAYAAELAANLIEVENGDDDDEAQETEGKLTFNESAFY